jgi:phosphatidylglycerol:prolipoprotein diacylglycerol transferase
VSAYRRYLFYFDFHFNFHSSEGYICQMLLHVIWDVDPVIFETSWLSPRWYGILFATGFVLGYMLLANIFKREGENQDLLDGLLLYMAIGTIVGARLGHVIFYNPGYYIDNPLQIINLPDGGLASHGAAIGIATSLWLWSRRVGKAALWTMDRMGPAIALGAFFVRMGNLVNSELVGTPSDVPWAFRFMQNYDTQPRHPVQLYEALAYLGIFITLWWAYNKGWGKARGKIAGLGLTLIFTARFFLEFFKETQIALEDQMPLHMGQILSIPIVAIGVYIFIRSSKQPNNQS